MSKGRILIIDDEEIVRISCQRILVPEGYEVKAVGSAAEGFAVLEGGLYDVVLTDLKMPDIDGIEVLSRIKKDWPVIEVIVVTGYQTINTAVQAIKLGAFDYLEKPFTPDGILAAVARAMERGGKDKGPA